MDNPRKYGNPPFRTAVIHGGPGAAGEMASVARELCLRRGTLEPLQTESTLEGQIEELRCFLEQNGLPPLCLIGFSWGAWLSFILTARYPRLVKKLILIGCGAFEERYAAGILEKRLKRMSSEDRKEVRELMHAVEGDEPKREDEALARLGVLIERADAFDPLPKEENEKSGIICRADIFRNVWNEAANMRKNGRLLELASHITCPVTAIHGDFDSHSAEGVRKPLSAALPDFRFILLEHCGHKPWIERQARNLFYQTMEKELS